MNEMQMNLLRQNRLMISDRITLETFYYVREAIAHKIGQGSPPLIIHISSNGGDVESGLDICDLIEFYPNMIVGIVHSCAASIGCLVLQACGWRVATTHAHLMIHEVSPHGSKVKLSVLRDPIKLSQLEESLETDQRQIYNFLFTRTGRKVEEVGVTCELERTMSAQEALEYGLLDQVIKRENEIRVPKK